MRTEIEDKIFICWIIFWAFVMVGLMIYAIIKLGKG